MIAVTLSNGEIGIADVKLRDREAYTFVHIAQDAVLAFRKDSYGRGRPHNAIASLIAQRQVYGPAVIVGTNAAKNRLHDAPQRYVEAYEINEQEKQESKEEKAWESSDAK